MHILPKNLIIFFGQLLNRISETKVIFWTKHYSRKRLHCFWWQKTAKYLMNILWILLTLKDSHREKVPSNKTPALAKSMDINIWVVGISNQLFLRSFLNWKKKKIKKNKVVTSKTPFFVMSLLCTPHSIFLNISFGRDSFLWKCCIFNLCTFN